MTNLYYQPPTDAQFDELKEKAIELWHQYDNEYGYVDEKVNRIKEITNVGDNFMYMVAMFDYQNMQKLADMLSPETRKAVRDRMLAGGNVEDVIPF